jgi:hypothetical protein
MMSPTWSGLLMLDCMYGEDPRDEAPQAWKNYLRLRAREGGRSGLPGYFVSFFCMGRPNEGAYVRLVLNLDQPNHCLEGAGGGGLHSSNAGILQCSEISVRRKIVGFSVRVSAGRDQDICRRSDGAPSRRDAKWVLGGSDDFAIASGFRS